MAAGLPVTVKRPSGGRGRTLLIYVLRASCRPALLCSFQQCDELRPSRRPGRALVGYIVATLSLGKVLFVTFLVARARDPDLVLAVGNKAEFQMMLAAIILVVFNVTFWTLFEQAARR